MVYTRRSKKLELQAAKVNTTERSLAPADEHFIWSTERKIALFQSMINRKPAGINKHINMILIKTDLSKRLGMDVPVKEIWRFLNAHWDLTKADRIELPPVFMIKKPFELPKTEEWMKLIKEEGELIDAREKRDAEAKKQARKARKARKAATSEVDLTTLKNVTIMVDRLDDNLFAHLLKKIKK
ncbi:unnamed protein product [Macrosiphum euphorbiae]|uniref:MRG-binding protein n=1 Tax=Macrosiphum euphorbiae TaxID=13131 RepID=A0AAV0WP51_9HEMI|nr:unnamed protein product [Macrosiphum euphorbiae]